jgi:hypothetical protein
MGFAGTLPMILKDRGASYSAIGTFALTSWPFSIKLLWAPLVDSIYNPQIGRRKTWLVPVQILIGVLLIGEDCDYWGLLSNCTYYYTAKLPKDIIPKYVKKSIKKPTTLHKNPSHLLHLRRVDGRRAHGRIIVNTSRSSKRRKSLSRHCDRGSDC